VANILVVHPELAERVILSIQLESRGFSPAAVGSASRALDRLATTPVDLVLSAPAGRSASRAGYLAVVTEDRTVAAIAAN
jgi:hypothetical protein